jgi:hypothetical protein
MEPVTSCSRNVATYSRAGLPPDDNACLTWAVFFESLNVRMDLDMWLRITPRYPRPGCSRRATSIYWRRPQSLTGARTERYGNELDLLDRLLIPVSRFVSRLVRRRVFGVRMRAQTLRNTP